MNFRNLNKYFLNSWNLNSIMMKKREFIKTLALSSAGLSLLSSLAGCSLVSAGGKMSSDWVWMNAGNLNSGEWREVFSHLKKAGIGGILLRGSTDDYKRIVPLAAKHRIDIHAWIITLNRAWDEEAKRHPEWFTVSRKGDSCYDVHPYVDYYQWVCPSREDVYQHVEKEVMSLLKIQGLKGVHLDYIRYSDVILPVGLWKKYNLVQDKEYPEFDFCYCDTCREKFITESGIDIRELADPTASAEWREYRWNSVTHFVNRLAEKVHNDSPDKRLTAAVFPYPEIARAICRQDWAKWNLDGFFPMIYHSFYNEDINWIGSSVAKGVADLNGKAPLFAGLFIPALSPETIGEAVDISLKNGAEGICYFDYGSLSEEHWSALAARK